MHPDHLLAALTSPQIGEWYAFLAAEPIGEQRADFRAGMICATVANYAGKQRADGSPGAQPADFMPSLESQRISPPEPLLMTTPEAQADLIRTTLFKGQNG